MRKMILIALLVPFTMLSADEIDLPHTFAAGTTAKAAEVNNNFGVLLAESNSQDGRLEALETTAAEVSENVTTLASENGAQENRLAALEAASTPTVSDQLICVVFNSWAINGSSYGCVQASNPTNVRSMTYAQVAEEQWVAVSVGGGDGSNRVTYIFYK